MELRQLEAFVAVAEEKSFTRAARLFLAQAGLSATVRMLEKDLHAPLFSPSTRRVELTPAGLALLAEARRTLAAARAASDVVAVPPSWRRLWRAGGRGRDGYRYLSWLVGLSNWWYWAQRCQTSGFCSSLSSTSPTRSEAK